MSDGPTETEGVRLQREARKLMAVDASPASACSPSLERRSPADICLERTETWIDFRPEDSIEISDDHHQLRMKIERRAWVCAFCGQSTEYWLANGIVVKGCGSSTRHHNGKISQACDRWQCQDEQEQFHSENVQGEAPLPENAVRKEKR